MQVIPWKDRNPDTVKEVVRGLEVARWNGFTRDWDVVGKFAATELAARQAAKDVKWLNERHPYELYQLRAVISLPKLGPEPVVLEADNDSTPTPDLPAEAANED